MGKKGPLWWRESDWLLRGSSAANQILLRHSGPILSPQDQFAFEFESERPNGNSATKQLPKYDSSDLDQSNGQMAI